MHHFLHHVFLLSSKIPKIIGKDCYSHWLQDLSYAAITKTQKCSTLIWGVQHNKGVNSNMFCDTQNGVKRQIITDASYMKKWMLKYVSPSLVFKAPIPISFSVKIETNLRKLASYGMEIFMKDPYVTPLGMHFHMRNLQIIRKFMGFLQGCKKIRWVGIPWDWAWIQLPQPYSFRRIRERNKSPMDPCPTDPWETKREKSLTNEDHPLREFLETTIL